MSPALWRVSYPCKSVGIPCAWIWGAYSPTIVDDSVSSCYVIFLRTALFFLAQLVLLVLRDF